MSGHTADGEMEESVGIGILYICERFEQAFAFMFRYAVACVGNDHLEVSVLAAAGGESYFTLRSMTLSQSEQVANYQGKKFCVGLDHWV